MGAVVAHFRAAPSRRSNRAAPGLFDASHEQSADHDHGKGAELSLEERGDPLVAREEIRDAAGVPRPYTEQTAGDVHGLAKSAGKRHVHPVIVAGCEVDGQKAASLEAGASDFRAAKEGGGANT